VKTIAYPGNEKHLRTCKYMNNLFIEIYCCQTRTGEIMNQMETPDVEICTKVSWKRVDVDTKVNTGKS
jgi:hypothetical protein